MVKFYNSITPTDMIIFEPNFFWMFPVIVLTEGAYRNFENSSLF